MKLLLTSSGLSSRYLAKELSSLLNGKSPADTKVAFVPTAANVESGNKDWVVNNFLNLWRYGYNYIDIIDPSAQDVDWQNRMAQADVIYLVGGNTFHLLHQARTTGFGDWLTEHLDDKVYVGGSASSILVTPNIGIASLGFGDENLPQLTDLNGLNWVGFEIAPHVPNSGTYEEVAAYAATVKHKVYALDDFSAIKVDGQEIAVVGTGTWKVYND